MTPTDTPASPASPVPTREEVEALINALTKRCFAGAGHGPARAPLSTALDRLYEARAREVVDLEQISAKVHDNWMASKRAAGVQSRKLESGEELMVPYGQLSEQAKELDRGTVRTVLAAMDSLRATPHPEDAETPRCAECKREANWLSEAGNLCARCLYGVSGAPEPREGNRQ